MSSLVEAIELLIGEAKDLSDEARFHQALAAANRAVGATEPLDDPALLIRALAAEERPLRLTGNLTGAMSRSVRILALAEDPVTSHLLSDPTSVWTVGQAHTTLADAALWIDEIPIRRVLDMLDHAERWLKSVGHWDWRSGVLGARSGAYHRLGEYDKAIAAAEEAIAAYSATAPGFLLSSLRLDLARRYDSRYVLYDATIDFVDAALDRGDRATAEAHLPDLATYAVVVDASTERTKRADEVADRRERLVAMAA
jgi:tetratricopeptide (TPR) repeat protein